jgi:hypothetical protein
VADYVAVASTVVTAVVVAAAAAAVEWIAVLVSVYFSPVVVGIVAVAAAVAVAVVAVAGATFCTAYYCPVCKHSAGSGCHPDNFLVGCTIKHREGCRYTRNLDGCAIPPRPSITSAFQQQIGRCPHSILPTDFPLTAAYYFNS